MEEGNPETPQTITLAAAAKLSGVSQVTLRKHLKAGRLEATQVRGKYGDAWAIAPDTLAAFVLAQYGRELTLSQLPPQETARASTETPQDLRRRLDETLIELGRYRALATASEDAAARVEAGLKERIAELQAERNAERAKAEEAAGELTRLRSRGFWARLFAGNG